MPQSGTGVSVEAVDPVFQTKMLDMLKQTGRYHVSSRSPLYFRSKFRYLVYLLLFSCFLVRYLNLDSLHRPQLSFQLYVGQRWWWGGITVTQALAAGFPE